MLYKLYAFVHYDNKKTSRPAPNGARRHKMTYSGGNSEYFPATVSGFSSVIPCFGVITTS